MVSTELKRHAAKVLRALRRDYPDVECALQYDSPVQLLVATILSAQCTDQRVNIVTKSLFRKLPTATHLARVPIKQLEKEIQSTGFFRKRAFGALKTYVSDVLGWRRFAPPEKSTLRHPKTYLN